MNINKDKDFAIKNNFSLEGSSNSQEYYCWLWFSIESSNFKSIHELLQTFRKWNNLKILQWNKFCIIIEFRFINHNIYNAINFVVMKINMNIHIEKNIFGKKFINYVKQKKGIK